MKFSIHQQIALLWALSASSSFAPVLRTAKRGNANEVIAWGIIIVAVAILLSPMVLQWGVLRRWFGWTDALSAGQLEAIRARDLRRYYRIAYEDGYVSRVLPFLRRVAWMVIGFMVITLPMPQAGVAALDALIVFTPLYPLGLMAVILASMPVARLFKQK
jgi:hypothetical protein